MSAKRSVVVVATVLLLVTSAAEFVFAQSPLLPLSGTSPQGPRIERIAFSVLPDEAAANASLFDGSIQAPEWGFSSAVWSSLVGRPGIIAGVQLGHTFDGIGFNTLRPYANNPHFRRAIEYLTDYNYLAKVVNSGPGGAAGPYFLPCRIYPGACYQGVPGASFDLAKAANELLYAGLVANVGGNLVCWGSGAGCSTAVHITIQNVSLISAWYRHQNPVPGGLTEGQDCSASPTSPVVTTTTTTLSSTSTTVKLSRTTIVFTITIPLTTTTMTNTATTSTSTITSVSTFTTAITKSLTTNVGLWSNSQRISCLFRPVFYYTSDDPLRSKVALSLISAASRIGFVFDSVGLPGNGTATVLAKTQSAVLSPGVYDPSTGQNDPAPVFQPSAVNSSDPNGVSDNWDLYTFSVTGSSAYTFQARMVNSAYVGSSGLNFANYYNATMDKFSNRVLYAATASAARIAARQVGKMVAQEAPYVVSFYEGTRWADNVGVGANGWTGFVSVPTNGPNTGGGLYYTSLDAHNVSLAFGDGATAQGAPLKEGTLKYGLGALPNGSGLDPLYKTESASQTDIWGEVYNTPLVAPPTRYGQANSFSNYLTSVYRVNNITGHEGGSVNLVVSCKPGVKGCLDPAKSPCQIGDRGCTRLQLLNTTTGTGPGWFNMQNPGTSQPARIVNGMNISFTFRGGLTWSDHTPLTASDYNFSLYAWGLSSPPSLPHEQTPLKGILSGPAGLWATHVVGNRIDIFVNSSSIWNLGEVVVPVLPQHLLSHFVTDYFSTADGAVDTTLPYETLLGNDVTGAVGTCPNRFCNLGPAPEWLAYLPNLEVGSGPFMLQSFNSVNGSGVLAANPTFFNTAWSLNASLNRFGAPLDLIVGAKSQATNVVMSPVREFIYNPTYSTFLGVPPLSRGYVPITNATSLCFPGQLPGKCLTAGRNITSATYTVYLNGKGSPVASGNLRCAETNGVCFAKMATHGLGLGTYEVVFTVTYNFLGLQRIWYQETGFRFG
ncbi:MAG TPA: ABC transporter substrate-binding protein [Nitrososphaerales archaeon]|nr:ABC transporter substrate-binding protein [Nitrososphaerales archaeon]